MCSCSVIISTVNKEGHAVRNFSPMYVSSIGNLAIARGGADVRIELEVKKL